MLLSLLLCLSSALLATAAHPAEVAPKTSQDKQPAGAGATGSKPTLLVVGDSLSAGYNIELGATWVGLLERRLAQQGYGYQVVNASVSGETTGGALARLPRALRVNRPTLVILELGGNDGLQALPLPQIRGNLDAMLKDISASGARTLLLGIRIPLNYGPDYVEKFHAMYQELATKYQAGLVDFFMERVALNPQLMQQDGIHPNTAAQPLLLDTLWPALQPLLEKTPRPGKPPLGKTTAAH
jgi:acyl-CoA thioesterase-1